MHNCTPACDLFGKPISPNGEYHGDYCECGIFYDAFSPFGDSGIEHDLYRCLNTPIQERIKHNNSDYDWIYGPLHWAGV